MPTYAYQSALSLRDAIRARQISPLELMRDVLARIERCDPVLNCYASLQPERALAAARDAEATLMSGASPGALHGLPISVKDLIAVQDMPHCFGSRTMAGNIAAADAPSVERLKNAGACIIGKSTTSEFGCKGVGDSPATGITRNPWDPAKTPGGSSAGAAASVAAGYTPFALGTDGGGSIRIPASLCGLFGIKANFARVPVWPVSATPTLAHVAPLARTVRDAALLLSVIAGHDRRDAYSIDGPVPDFLAACEKPVRGMRIAWSPTLGYAKPDAEVRAICERAALRFADLGCEVVEVERVFDEDPVELWVSEFYAGVGVRLEEPLTQRRELLDPAVAEVLQHALAQTSKTYYTKVFARYALRERLRLFFERYDLLLSPTLPVAAFDVGLDVPPGLPGRSIVSWVYYTYPFNLSGQPAASLPVGFTSAGLPVGLQMVARINTETDVFRAAAAYEAAHPWTLRTPDRFPG